MKIINSALKILLRPYVNLYNSLNHEKQQKIERKRKATQFFQNGGYEILNQVRKREASKHMSFSMANETYTIYKGKPQTLKLPTIYEFIEMQKPVPPQSRKI